MNKKSPNSLCLFFAAIFLDIGSACTQNYQLGDSLYIAKNYEAAIIEYESAMKIYEAKKDWDSLNLTINQISYSYHALKKYKEAVARSAKVLSLLEATGKNSSFALAKLFLLRGVAFRNLEDYSKSLQSYERAISIYERNKSNHHNVSYAYRNAALIYLRRLDYDKTIDYLQKALNADSTNTYNGSILGYLASTYMFIGNYEKAIFYEEEGLKSSNLSEWERSNLLSWGADAWKGKGDLGKAERLTKQALKLLEPIAGNERVIAKKYLFLAEIEFERKNFNQVNRYIKDVLKLNDIAFKNKDREASMIYVSIGDIYKAQRSYDKALDNYQQALIQLFPNFNSTNIADNPSINDIYTESWIMTASGRKGEALKHRYDLSCDTADLKNASECFDLSITGVQALKYSYGTDAAKLYLGDYSHNYFEQAIEVNYLLYKETGRLQHLEKVFAIMEQSKATVLAEAVQKNRALLLAGIPDSLLEKEMEIRLALADLNTEIKLEELNGDEMDEERIKNLRNQQGMQQRQYESLFAQLKEQYPSFRAFVERRNVPKISDAQALAKREGAAFLQYFTGEKAVYLLAILPEKAFIFKIERTPGWDKTIENYLAFFQNNAAITSAPSGYFEAASSLYAALVPFALQGILPENLIIVPDGLLALVPFDALVAKKPETANFTEADFLIKKYNIRYAYSAGLLLDPISIKKRKGKLLSVAPLFAQQERGLSGLQYSTEETSALKKLIVLQDKYATLAHFKEMAAQSRLLHLSTHAGAANVEGIPTIEFIDTSLYLPEIYAMNLPLAELVVLSACETGLGKFEKGEGIMSLARGFAYAGANSLVASLWRVNERSTATLFSHFYQNLLMGKSKSEALRDAKLTYLNEADSDAKLSPYYWAGFSFIGQDGPMDLSSDGLPNWAYAIGGLGLIGFVFIFFKKQRKMSFG